ncbi:MAG: recombination regulator RecX [Lachnospiraceae bacterium]|nr:recombination regulator RecX [Lachnospiraceae bacterium]
MMKNSEDDPLKKAKKRAMDILTHRDKTEKELREKLLGDGYEPGVADEAVAYVKSYGYIDDERYAGNYIAYRMDKKSRMVLRRELLARGIEENLLDSVLEEHFSQVDEDAVVIACIEKKCRGTYPGCLPGRSDEKEYGKLMRYLMGRGYSFDCIRRVMKGD